jgi:hypothetical protein
MFKNLFKKNPLVFNRSAAARVLKISHNLILRFEEWENCVFLIVKGQRPRFWTKKDYRANFAAFRKEASKELEATRLDLYSFKVANKAKDSIHYLDAKPNTIQCNCEDYRSQVRLIDLMGGTAFCKHGYAALGLLGFDRLSDYIREYEWLADDYYQEIDYDEANHYIFGGVTHW